MTEHEIGQALEKYEEELNEMPNDELIGDEQLQAMRDAEIDWRLDEYQGELEEMPDDELLDLETIREEIITELVEKKAQELESPE
jgi:hypothetical protein